MRWLVILQIGMVLITGCQLKEAVFDRDAKRVQDETDAAEEAVPAELITIQRMNISSEKIYPASIEGRQSVKIIPRIDGYLQYIMIKEGEFVKRDQTLFVMDQANYKAEISIAKANVDAAKAEVANAQLSLDSKRRLREKSIISEFELRQAEINLKLAEAQLEQSQAQLCVAQNNLSYTTLKSPSDGVVGRLPYHVGDYVGPSVTDGLTTIADTSEMYIFFSLTERGG